ncbi:epoxide hydrolase [Sphingomonas sp. Leaf231]|uniref:alpha/beta hydrolase n=1 Tax=Sphingomonas sp. Leaf231 TaxID=1736301 RepID=UPI0006FA0E7F|nr:alpha/beta hydrolase [Sphingomonas sp. Leaf231]KQN93198.1 epoxide hydrolase [Sphingomonas sp. Leaf231]
MPEARMIETGAVRLRAMVEGDGPLIVLVHGFPESWYSWRHQLAPLAVGGYTAAAIDVRGYGGSDKPEAIEAYDMAAMVDDIIGVADALQPGRPVVLVGHDWGAPMVWYSALTRPDRVAAVAALSVPFTGVPARPLTEIFRHAFTDRDRFFYQEWFQRCGPPEEEAEADVRGYLRRLYFAISGEAPPGSWPDKPAGATLLDGLVDPGRFPAWLNDDDLDYLVAQFKAGGFRGPLNRYRNHERDFSWAQAWRGHRIEQPALFIGGTRDPASFGFGAYGDPLTVMRPHVPEVLGHMLDGCGHWTQQERPEEVNRLLLAWLARLPTRPRQE